MLHLDIRVDPHSNISMSTVVAQEGRVVVIGTDAAPPLALADIVRNELSPPPPRNSASAPHCVWVSVSTASLCLG